MKDEIKQLLTNAVITGAGIFVSFQFTKEKYTLLQIIAFIVTGSVCSWLLYLTKLSPLLQNGISYVVGIGVSRLVKGLIKGWDKSEDKIADKLSKKIEDTL